MAVKSILNGKPYIRAVCLIAALFILAPFVIGSSCSSDGSTPLDRELSERLRKVLTDNMEEFGIPGALAGVWIPGEGRLIIEEGVSDIDNDEPIAKSDHVRIGSVTKSITVTVILQLAEEGARQSISTPHPQRIRGRRGAGLTARRD